MSASSVTNPIISKVTISLFEDSGWYVFRRGAEVNGKVIDYERFYWLQGYGCEIIGNVKCPANAHACSSLGTGGCSYDNTFRGTCDNVDFGNGCNYFVPSSPWENSDCRVMNPNNEKLKQYSRRYYNVNGPGSRCFNGFIQDSISGFAKASNFCFQPRCVQNKQKNYDLQIKYGNKWLTCKSSNEKLKVTGKKSGFISCPSDISKFCQRYAGGCEKDCYGRGRCMQNRKCQCYAGFSGESCGDRTLLSTKNDGSYDINSLSITEVTVKSKDCCKNGGVYNNMMGICLCNVGYTGTTCENVDNLTKSYYKAPKNSVTSSSCGVIVTKPKGKPNSNGNSSNGTKGNNKPEDVVRDLFNDKNKKPKSSDQLKAYKAFFLVLAALYMSN